MRLAKQAGLLVIGELAYNKATDVSPTLIVCLVV